MARDVWTVGRLIDELQKYHRDTTWVYIHDFRTIEEVKEKAQREGNAEIVEVSVNHVEKVGKYAIAICTNGGLFHLHDAACSLDDPCVHTIWRDPNDEKFEEEN